MNETVNKNELIKSRFNREFKSWNSRYNSPYKNTINYSLFIRKKIILDELSKIVHTEKQLNILEIGCGSANLAQSIKKKYPSFNITCTDISPLMIERNIQSIKNVRFEVLNIDTDDIPEGKSYDIVLMAGVIGYCENPSIVFKKLHNCLNINGTIIFSFGNKQSIFRKIRNLGIRLNILPIFKQTIGRLYKVKNDSNTLAAYTSYSIDEMNNIIGNFKTYSKPRTYSFSSGIFGRISVLFDILLEKCATTRLSSFNAFLGREILFICKKE